MKKKFRYRVRLYQDTYLCWMFEFNTHNEAQNELTEWRKKGMEYDGIIDREEWP